MIEQRRLASVLRGKDVSSDDARAAVCSKFFECLKNEGTRGQTEPTVACQCETVETKG